LAAKVTRSPANARTNVEILMFEAYTVLYKIVNDALFFMLTSTDENELITLRTSCDCSLLTFLLVTFFFVAPSAVRLLFVTYIYVFPALCACESRDQNMQLHSLLNTQNLTINMQTLHLTAEALTCVEATMQSLLKKNVTKRTLMDNLDLVLVALDEIVDGELAHVTPDLVFILGISISF
jgi:hypothetical protein